MHDIKIGLCFYAKANFIFAMLLLVCIKKIVAGMPPEINHLK